MLNFDGSNGSQDKYTSGQHPFFCLGFKTKFKLNNDDRCMLKCASCDTNIKESGKKIPQEI